MAACGLARFVAAYGSLRWRFRSLDDAYDDADDDDDDDDDAKNSVHGAVIVAESLREFTRFT